MTKGDTTNSSAEHDSADHAGARNGGTLRLGAAASPPSSSSPSAPSAPSSSRVADAQPNDEDPEFDAFRFGKWEVPPGLQEKLIAKQLRTIPDKELYDTVPPGTELIGAGGHARTSAHTPVAKAKVASLPPPAHSTDKTPPESKGTKQSQRTLIGVAPPAPGSVPPPPPETQQSVAPAPPKALPPESSELAADTLERAFYEGGRAEEDSNVRAEERWPVERRSRWPLVLGVLVGCGVVAIVATWLTFSNRTEGVPSGHDQVERDRAPRPTAHAPTPQPATPNSEHASASPRAPSIVPEEEGPPTKRPAISAPDKVAPTKPPRASTDELRAAPPPAPASPPAKATSSPKDSRDLRLFQPGE